MQHTRRTLVGGAVAVMVLASCTAASGWSALGAPAGAAPSTDPLVVAVQDANPFLQPLGATTLTGADAEKSFGDPLPGVLDDSEVERVQLVSFSGYCGGAPQAESLSAVVTTSGDSDAARELIETLVVDAADGGDVLREASASGHFGRHAREITIDGRRGYRFRLTDNESEGYVRAGTVVVVRVRARVVIVTALCGVGRTAEDRKERAVETQQHARAFTVAIMTGLRDGDDRRAPTA
jgi:hypothetical protein